MVVLAHPDIANSKANRPLAEAAARIDNVLVHDLYAVYPDLFVDGNAERALLESVDAVVFQHPIYWYAAPGLFKEWLDRTLIHGWAYGRDGDALKGKKLLSSITTGSPAEDYQSKGTHGNPIEDYLKPYRQTAKFCGMDWQKPLIFHQARTAEPGLLESHIETFKKRLTKLAGGK